MIVTVQGEREHDEEEDMCQEKEKDRYAEKEMYPDEAHIATAPLAALDQFDLGEKDTGPKQPKLHHYPKEHFGLQKKIILAKLVSDFCLARVLREERFFLLLCLLCVW